MGIPREPPRLSLPSPHAQQGPQAGLALGRLPMPLPAPLPTPQLPWESGTCFRHPLKHSRTPPAHFQALNSAQARNSKLGLLRKCEGDAFGDISQNSLKKKSQNLQLPKFPFDTKDSGLKSSVHQACHRNVCCDCKCLFGVIRVVVNPPEKRRRGPPEALAPRAHRQVRGRRRPQTQPYCQC